MNSCSQNRKQLAWMAAGALDSSEAGRICAHLETCEGCRCYYQEILRITALLSVEPEPTIRTSQAFHERVMLALLKKRKLSVWESAAAWLRDSVRNARVALPVGAAIALAVTALLVSWGRGHRTFPPQKPIEYAATPALKADLEPTLSHYQTVANQSLEKFDELLSAQANQNPFTGPVFSTSPLGRSDVLD